MSYILPLLEEMRGRLGMYVGSTSLTKLAAFVRGYDYAAYKGGAATPDPVLTEFQDWVNMRFQATSQSWEEVIISRSADEADAVKRFWELLDEFSEESKPNGCVTIPRDRE